MIRFTIRDVLWLTVVVGMGAAWFIDHRAIAVKLSQSQRDLREACFQLGMKPSPFD